MHTEGMQGMDVSDFGGWDPSFTRRAITAAKPIGKRWFRWRVHGLDTFPTGGGALVVSNHSGGIFTADTLILATALYDRFGYHRPVLTLGHTMLFQGPQGRWLSRIGLIHAERSVANNALRSGAVVLVFPGGIYDAYRPTARADVVDFNGRTGYVRTAVESRVPIVPVVSTGGQQSQLFLTRGTWLAKRLGLTRFRSDILPITFGFPFGLSAILPVNMPLPTKIVTQVLAPINVVDQFGDDPDVHEVDAHVRDMMQTALRDLERQRRWPIIG